MCSPPSMCDLFGQVWSPSFVNLKYNKTHGGDSKIFFFKPLHYVSLFIYISLLLSYKENVLSIDTEVN